MLSSKYQLFTLLETVTRKPQ